MVYNIDYERLAQEIARIQRTTPENITDISNNTELKLQYSSRNFQEAKSASFMRNDATQENPMVYHEYTTFREYCK